MGMLGGGAGGSATGAPGGGPLGAMGMDFGLYKMPVIGSFFTDPNAVFKQQQFHQMGQAYSQYRPEVMQARMNALNNRLSSYQGASDVLAAMMGRNGSTQGQQLSRTPMGPSMMQQGASKGADVPPADSMFGQNGMLGGMMGNSGGPMDGMLGGGMGGGLPGMGGGGGGLLGGMGGLGGLFGGF